MLWLLKLVPLLGKVPTALWGAVRRNPLAAGLAVLLVVQMLTARLEAGRLIRQVEQQKDELAALRGALQKLSDAAATLKPGETKTIFVDRPFPVTVPGATRMVEKEVPVIVTRTEHTVETKVQTVTLPGKEIERIIRDAPQSIVADLTATRDIKAGEKFRVVVSQIQPGIWQPILELGAPITAEVRTVTPVERIPQLPAERRLEVRPYIGLGWIAGGAEIGVGADILHVGDVSLGADLRFLRADAVGAAQFGLHHVAVAASFPALGPHVRAQLGYALSLRRCLNPGVPVGCVGNAWFVGVAARF